MFFAVPWLSVKISFNADLHSSAKGSINEPI